MSVGFEPDEIDRFRHFLSEFSTSHSGPLSEDDPLPVRLICYYLSQEEVEGECLDWSLTYLSLKDCPTPLDLYIAREVVDNVLCVDLKQFLQQETYPDEEPQLEASRLALTMFNTLYDICRRWSEHLPLEKMKKAQMIIDVHAHAIKNTRRKMEDRHVALPYFNPLLGLKVTHANDCALEISTSANNEIDALMSY